MRRAVIGLAATLSFGATTLAAQDAYYWAETYGTYATLLGGVVVGKVPDISAAFYNPGRLAFATGPAISLTTRVYQLASTKLDLSGTAYSSKDDLGTTSVRPSPSFAAGVLPIGDTKKTVLAYSLVTRQSDDKRIEGNAYDPAGTPPGQAEIFYHRQATESWYGLSYSRRVSTRTGIGATLFGAYRSQFQRAEIHNNTDAPPEVTQIIQQTDYYDLRFIVKAGVSTDLGGWAVGATVQTPGLHFFGSGSRYYSDATTGGPTPQFAYSQDQDIKVNYKSSWTVAAGVTRTINNVSLYFSTEWFAPVEQYALVDAESVVPTDPRAPFERDMTFGRRSVVNWGLGVEIRQSASRALYFHVKSDVSARPPRSGINATYERWGRYAAGGGYAFRLSNWDLVAGLSFESGSDKYTANDPDGAPGGVPISPNATATLSDWKLRFLFGFNVRL